MFPIVLNLGGGERDLPKVIKCTFSKSFLLTSLAHRRHFRHQGRSKLGQSHPRSSSAFFQNVNFWPPMIHWRHQVSPLGGRSRSERLSELLGEWVSECLIRTWRSDCPQRDHIFIINKSYITYKSKTHLIWVIFQKK